MKNFDKERENLREVLSKDLSREALHQKELLTLKHQKALELLRSKLKLEQANRAKFETLLQESKVQSEKLAERLTFFLSAIICNLS